VSELVVDLGGMFADSRLVVSCSDVNSAFTTGISFKNGYEDNTLVITDDEVSAHLQGGESTIIQASNPPDGPYVTTTKVFLTRGFGATEATVTFVSEANFHSCWAYVTVVVFPVTDVPVG
jgi:hypothetical protein